MCEKIKLIKIIGSYGDEEAIGKIHLSGIDDATACGLSYDEYKYASIKKASITCSTCISMLQWAKNVSKIKS